MAWALDAPELDELKRRSEARGSFDAVRPAPRGGRVLVLEGGGLRGAFTAGVLQQFARQGVMHFDAVYATSAGAPSAAYCVAGQIDDAIHIWEHRTHGSQLVSWSRPLRGRTLMDIEGLVDLFRAEVPLQRAALDSADVDLYVAVTNCITGKGEHIRIDANNAFPLLNATMALPFAYGRIVRIDGMPYVDGGLASAIPLKAALDAGATDITVVLTRPKGYRKRRQLMAQAAFRVNYRRYPALWPTFERRFRSYNEQLEELEGLERAGRVRVIRPPAHLPAARMTQERNKIVESVEIGRRIAEQWLRDERSMLANHAPANHARASSVRTK